MQAFQRVQAGESQAGQVVDRAGQGQGQGQGQQGGQGQAGGEADSLQALYKERVTCIEYAITQRQLWIHAARQWLAAIHDDVAARHHGDAFVAFDEADAHKVQGFIDVWARQQDDARTFLEQRSSVHGTIQKMRATVDAWTTRMEALSSDVAGQCLQSNPALEAWMRDAIAHRRGQLERLEALLLETSDTVVEGLYDLT